MTKINCSKQISMLQVDVDNRLKEQRRRMGVPGGTQLLQGTSWGEGAQHTSWKLGEQPEAECPEQNK